MIDERIEESKKREMIGSQEFSFFGFDFKINLSWSIDSSRDKETSVSFSYNARFSSDILCIVFQI
jgi:hypothetical protein